ncbi:NAD(P)/FAD-dependent oxidoreductase [Candidatus Woesearchaeota archaeon]|nr:NAD(P)/FAD-dependent oxidoreductase [Candidatus Woesearchaeota archaeon]
MHDTIIIGGGPAGLSAAINTSLRGLSTLVIEQNDRPGGLPLVLYPDKVIKDHPGFPVGILAKEFARLIEMQAKNSGVEIRCNEEALKIEKKEDFFHITTSNACYQSKRIIFCTGLLNIPKKLPILEKFRDVHYKLGNVEQFKNKRVAVIGAGDNAFDSSLHIKDVAEEVCIIMNKEKPKAKENTVKQVVDSGIRIYYESEITFIEGNKFTLKSLKTEKETEISIDTVFSAIGFSTINNFLKESNIEANPDGTIKVDKNFETSVKGIFAAGDLNGEPKLISVACARGIQAAMYAFSSVKRPYWLK